MQIFQTIKTLLKRFPRHWVVAASAWTSKIIVSLVNIISIRELLLYLGEERYAVYLVAYSLTAWFALTHFNVASSLQNFISESRARNENYDKYMLSALQILVFLFVFFTIIVFIISSPIQAAVFRKFPPLNDPIVLIIGIISITTSLSSIIYSIYYAEHKGYIPNILPAAASIVSVMSIVTLRHYGYSPHLLTALLIFTIPQMLFPLILFIRRFKKFFSRLFEFDFENIKTLSLRASKFYFTTISFIIYSQTDYIIASQVLPVEEIIKYGIFTRFFLFPMFIYESLLAAAWPVRSEMFVRKNYDEIKEMLKRYSYYGIALMVLSSLLIFIFSDFIIKILAPNTNIKANASLIILFAVYVIVRSVSNNYSSFLSSINALRIFAYILPFQIIINITAQYFLAKTYGAQGIIMGLILSVVLTTLWVFPLKTRKILK